MATADVPIVITGPVHGFMGVMNYVCSNTSYLVGSITNDRCPRGVWLRGGDTHGVCVKFCLENYHRVMIWDGGDRC